MTADRHHGPQFDVRDIPFSHHGSWFGLSPVLAQHRRSEDLHLVSHQNGMHAVLALRPHAAEGAPARVRVDARAARLSWIEAEGRGRIDAVYETPDTLRLRGRGLGLRIAAAIPELTPFTGVYLYRDPVDGACVFTSYETGRRYRVTVLTGDWTQEGDQALRQAERAVTVSGPDWEAVIEECESGRPPYRGREAFEAVEAASCARFADFLERVAPWRGERTPGAELAVYVLWSATVRPAGVLTRPAVLMSKHWMDKVWSWDHCFNALALAAGEPELAWHQFRLPFDFQDEGGALPDSVTHSEVLYNFVKPPLHGWALGRLRERLPPLAGPELAATYELLERWTEYWLSRRAPDSPLPHTHHGNDTGWDNATTFDAARVLETADLAALLVLQMRQLSSLAAELRRRDAAAGWSARAERLLAALLEILWTGDRFASRNVRTGELSTGESLLGCVPIVLGRLLPAKVHDTLARRIARHLGDHGLATEPPESPRYEADGYWRGPIWAPSTVLIEHGLRDAGYTAMADRVSGRFRRLCESAGFAENFDARTGAGQRDRAYTWTASSYLLLAEAAEQRGPVPRGRAEVSGDPETGY